jgi:hypothetical protein
MSVPPAVEAEDLLAGGRSREHWVSALQVAAVDEVHDRPGREVLARITKHTLERAVLA